MSPERHQEGTEAVASPDATTSGRHRCGSIRPGRELWAGWPAGFSALSAGPGPATSASAQQAGDGEVLDAQTGGAEVPAAMASRGDGTCHQLRQVGADVIGIPVAALDRSDEVSGGVETAVGRV